MSRVRYYCTYFDQNYLIHGLTLYRSLSRHSGQFILWVLCLDNETLKVLEQLRLPNVRPVALAELEEAAPDLRAVKEVRSRIEYYFTLSPMWPQYLLDRIPDNELLTYLDADLFFFSDPGPIFAELGDGSVLIVGHRFPPHLGHLEQFGVYNVGLLSFRNDAHGNACLRRWGAQCLEWCYDRVEPGRFADQKYLDDWPTTLKGVRVLQNKGAGLAPWNWSNYSLSNSSDGIRVDGQPLIFFHFQGLKIINRWLYSPSGAGYGRTSRRLRRGVYEPYLGELARTRSWICASVPSARGLVSRPVRYASPGFRHTIALLRRGYVYPRLGGVTL